MAKIRNGTIVKKSGEKTVKVAVERVVTHPLYKKKYRVSKHYLVHDESGKHAVGETVAIIETKPLSKNKHFKIVDKNQ